MSQTLLRRGSRSDAVLVLQQMLESLGYDLGGADGVFGGRTEQAVQAVQRAYGLGADGVVGPKTLAVLEAAAEPAGSELGARVLRLGCRGEDVRTVQESLARLGFDPGAADGALGPHTVKAINGFLAAQGLAAEGTLGPEGLMALVQASA